MNQDQDKFQKNKSEEEDHKESNSPKIPQNPYNFDLIKESHRLFEPPEEADFRFQLFNFYPSINRFKANNFNSYFDFLDKDDVFFNKFSTDENTNFTLLPIEEKNKSNIFDSNNRIAKAFNLIYNDEDEEQHDINIDINDEPEPVLKPLFTVEHKKPLGRKKKDDLTSVRKHTKISNDNASKKYMTQCMISVCNYINSKIYQHGKLEKPNITQFLPPKVDLIKAYLEQNIRIFFENYPEPRNALDKNSYRVHNRNLLNLIDVLDIDEVNLMFHASFVDYFLAFLNDDRIVNGNIFLNKHFKTLKQCFNDYSDEEKNSIKDYCIRLINGKIKPRNTTKK